MVSPQEVRGEGTGSSALRAAGGRPEGQPRAPELLEGGLEARRVHRTCDLGVPVLRSHRLNEAPRGKCASIFGSPWRGSWPCAPGGRARGSGVSFTVTWLRLQSGRQNRSHVRVDRPVTRDAQNLPTATRADLLCVRVCVCSRVCGEEPAADEESFSLRLSEGRFSRPSAVAQGTEVACDSLRHLRSLPSVTRLSPVLPLRASRGLWVIQRPRAHAARPPLSP